MRNQETIASQPSEAVDSEHRLSSRKRLTCLFAVLHYSVLIERQAVAAILEVWGDRQSDRYGADLFESALPINFSDHQNSWNDELRVQRQSTVEPEINFSVTPASVYFAMTARIRTAYGEAVS